MMLHALHDFALGAWRSCISEMSLSPFRLWKDNIGNVVTHTHSSISALISCASVSLLQMGFHLVVFFVTHHCHLICRHVCRNLTFGTFVVALTRQVNCNIIKNVTEFYVWSVWHFHFTPCLVVVCCAPDIKYFSYLSCSFEYLQQINLVCLICLAGYVECDIPVRLVSIVNMIEDLWNRHAFTKSRYR